MKIPYLTRPVCGRLFTAVGLAVTAATVHAADYQSTVLQDGPLAYYALAPSTDPDGVSPDLTGNGNAGAASSLSSAAGPSAFIPDAAAFDGGYSYVELGQGNNGMLNFSGPITMEAWVQPINSSWGLGNILAKGYDSAYNKEIELRVNGDRDRNVYAGGSGSAGVSGGAQTPNWTYVVLSSDGTYCTLYINGVQIAQTGDTAGAVTFPSPWRIGTGSGDYGNDRYFNGNICQVAIYAKGLTAAQVKAHYYMGSYGTTNPPPKIVTDPVANSVYPGGTARFVVSANSALPLTYQWYKGTTPLADQTNAILVLSNIQTAAQGSYNAVVYNTVGSVTSASAVLTVVTPSVYGAAVAADQPLAYYPMDETTGTTAIDYFGGFNGTYKNAPALGMTGPSAFIASSVTFDGSSQSIDLGNPAELNFGGAISMEAWVQPAVVGTSLNYIVGKGFSWNPYYEVELRADPTSFNSGCMDGSVSGGTRTTNWTHLVSTCDGTNWKLYQNGALVGQSSGTINTYSAPWAIGSGTLDGANRHFNGNISQVAIYNHALTATQVQNHFYMGLNGTSPANTPPLITVQPGDQTCNPGGTVIFNVQSFSALPVTYQWFKNTLSIGGNTNATLTLTNVQPNQAGNYTVKLTSSAGTTTSSAAALVVKEGDSLTWSASNNYGEWNTATTANWIERVSGLAAVFHAYDKVTFDDTLAAPTTVSLYSVVMPGAITNDSSVNNYTISGTGAISGTGGLVKKGSSTLTLSTANTFSGPLLIQQGKVVQTVSGALGSSLGSVIVTNLGVLELNGIDLGSKPSVISGGALVNSAGDIYDLASEMTLVGDSTISGNRVDFGSRTSIKTDGQARNLTISGGYREFVNPKIDVHVANINVKCTIGLKNMTSLGDPAGVLTLEPGSELDFWSGNGPAKTIHAMASSKVQIFTGGVFTNGFIFEDGVNFNMYGGDVRTFTGPVTLNGMVNILLGDHPSTFSNVISGPGGIYWTAWNNLLVLTAANTYSGMTYLDGQTIALSGNGSISASTPLWFGGNNSDSARIDASGRNDQTLTLATGQKLFGTGKVVGNLVVASGATLTPGTNGVLGALKASVAVTLNGTTAMKLNGSGTNDQLIAGTTLTYGGTLSLTDLSGTLAAGNSFQLFNATTYAGAFSSITPATPGAGLMWDTTQLNAGKLGVVTAVASQPVVGGFKVVAGNVILSGTGGVPNAAFTVVTTTNVTTVLANWTVVGTGNFDGAGAFNITNVITPGAKQQFYKIKQ